MEHQKHNKYDFPADPKSNTKINTGFYCFQDHPWNNLLPLPVPP